jgi:hypothetical protein
LDRPTTLLLIAVALAGYGVDAAFSVWRGCPTSCLRPSIEAADRLTSGD